MQSCEDRANSAICNPLDISMESDVVDMHDWVIAARKELIVKEKQNDDANEKKETLKSSQQVRSTVKISVWGK